MAGEAKRRSAARQSAICSPRMPRPCGVRQARSEQRSFRCTPPARAVQVHGRAHAMRALFTRSTRARMPAGTAERMACSTHSAAHLQVLKQRQQRALHVRLQQPREAEQQLRAPLAAQPQHVQRLELRGPAERAAGRRQGLVVTRQQAAAPCAACRASH